jgi:hypothetical protein
MRDLMKFKTYAELKKYSNKHALKLSATQRLQIVERMRQLRYGYEPGTLKRQMTPIKTYTMEEFRAITEKEYEEEIKKYGPR